MSMRARAKQMTANDINFRVYSKLNTKLGTLAFDGYGRKFWGFNGEKSYNSDTRIRIGPGFRFTAGTNRPVSHAQLCTPVVGSCPTSHKAGSITC